MHFTGLDPTAFLRDYWQKKPRLLRNAWTGWANPLSPDELAGLACAAGIDSRLVIGKPKAPKVEHGPFAAKRFARLGKHPWTVLVQAVDLHVPHVAALRDAFGFLPGWRIDDVMVSYASDGGGVGPHFDRYDVFLIQGLGQRRWRIGGRCDAATPLRPHDDLRLLAAFDPVEEWVLMPGDMLYLPPGIAHDGIAVGDDCMTYSIGFRAPSRSELIAHFADHLLAELGEDDRYADPDLRPAADPDEITDDAIDRLHAMILEKVQDRAAFARWFASHVTMPKYGDADDADDADRDDPAMRRASIRGEDGTRLRFVNGVCLGPEC